jgi:DNA (cytosine-5)-methyltransferase 1
VASRQPTAIDLFCGAGGLSAGLQLAGFRVLAGVDSWEPAERTYRANFNHPFIRADIRALTGEALLRGARIEGPIDLIAGGPPCQGFSIQRIGKDSDGRNDLVLEFVRLVLELAPAAFLMENVPGLIGKRGTGVVSEFEKRLAHGGYEVRGLVVNAADYGVPQLRRRVLYCGWPAGNPPLSLPKPTHRPEDYVTVWQAISDLPAPPDDPGTSAADPLHSRSRLSELNLRRLRLIPPGGGFEDLPVELRVKAHKGGASRIGHRNVYGRLDPSRPAGTITARFDSFTRGKFAHPFVDRNITLREGARLQTFEDSFEFFGSREEIAALIGNAIPPKLAHLVATALDTQLTTASAAVNVVDLLDDQLRLFPAAGT